MKWGLLLGGIVVFVVAISLLETLVRTEPTPSENGSAIADAARSPAPPELRRLDDGAIEIRHDFFHRSTIRLGNEEEERALFDCLAQGLEQKFGDGTEGWDHAGVRHETKLIQDQCLGLHRQEADLPLPDRNGPADVDAAAMPSVPPVPPVRPVAPRPGIRRTDADGAGAVRSHDDERSQQRDEQSFLGDGFHDDSLNGYFCKAIPAPNGSWMMATLPLRISGAGSSTTLPPRLVARSTASLASSTLT